jgi:tetratricopeptide (TPR) repeat protein
LGALAACALALSGAAARAQALDEGRYEQEGRDAVLRVHFNVRVQFLRAIPIDAAREIEIDFQLLGGDDALTRPTEESLHVPGQGAAPEASIIYPVQIGTPVKRIVVRLDRVATYQARPGASNQDIDIVFPGLAAPAAAPRMEAARGLYAIALQAVPLGEQAGLHVIPSRLQDKVVTGSEITRDGQRLFELTLGYYDTLAEAEAVRASLLAEFPQARVVDLKAPPGGPAPAPGTASVPAVAAAPAAAIPVPTPPLAPPPPPAPVAAVPLPPAPVAAAPSPTAPDSDLDRQAADLLAAARAALAAGRSDEAVNALNRLLLLPPNKSSQDAQELVGVARERAGDLAQARQEYELYLRLFPEGEGAARVRQRLASLAPPEEASTEAARPQEHRAPQASAGGSISQYYYGGDQKVLTLFPSGTVQVNQQTISDNVQSSLATTIDLNGRYRTDSTDTRVVFRDTDQYSFISSVAPGINRLDAAYVDYRDGAVGYGLKVGRQSGVTGGLVGRFDGAVLSVEPLPKLRLNAVAGVPVSQDEFVQANQRFEGLSLEALDLADHWSGSAFLINQTADGIVDRRAVGGDLRYFDQHRTLYALVDYDVQFAAVNAATLQGTWQFEDATLLSLLLDDRKAPTLTTSNGLLEWGCTSYTDYFAGTCQKTTGGPFTVASLRQAAEATTANSHQLALDASRPLNKTWQVSLDARVTSVGALPTVTIANQTFQGTSATGNVFGLTAQATGTNLYSGRDIDVFSATRLHSETLDGTQFSVNNLNGLLDNRLTLSPSLAYYRESDSDGQRLQRWTPGLHAAWQLTPRMSFDATVSIERTSSSGPDQNDTTTNVFYYLGYRYDLNW